MITKGDMVQAVILAGGMGSRLSEETTTRPKPLVEIGGKPIIWHLMKSLSCSGISEFIILGGYKVSQIKEYFINYHFHNSNLSINLKNGEVSTFEPPGEDWTVSIIDTGEHTATGGRLLRARKLIKSYPFLFTYGDGLSNIQIDSLTHSHVKSGMTATVTAVRPQGRFGNLSISNLGDLQVVSKFDEKGDNLNSWINGGFFLLNQSIFNCIANEDTTSFEYDTLEYLAREGQLNAYCHEGFWHAMDTVRDKIELESMWQTKAPWKTW